MNINHDNGHQGTIIGGLNTDKIFVHNGFKFYKEKMDNNITNKEKLLGMWIWFGEMQSR